MTDIISSMPSPVFALDRVLYASRAAMVEAITSHLKNGEMVQVEDSYYRSRAMRLCYEIRPGEAAFRLFGAYGGQLGVFANIAALVDHAEAITAV